MHKGLNQPHIFSFPFFSFLSCFLDFLLVYFLRQGLINVAQTGPKILISFACASYMLEL